MKYAYRIYKNSPSFPVIGGTVTANSLDDAAQKAVKQNNVDTIHESRHGLDYHYFMLNGSKVGILVYLNPEEY